MRVQPSGASRLTSRRTARASLASLKRSPLGRIATSSCALETSIPTYTSTALPAMFASNAADRVPPCAIRARDAAPATVRTPDRHGWGRGDSRSPTASRGPGRCDLPRPGFNLCDELVSQIQGRMSIAKAGEGREIPRPLPGTGGYAEALALGTGEIQIGLGARAHRIGAGAHPVRGRRFEVARCS